MPTEPEEYNYDSVDYNLEDVNKAVIGLKGLLINVASQISDLSTFSSESTDIDSSAFSSATECVKGSANKAGLFGPLQDAVNRARAVRNAILEANGVNVELFEEAENGIFDDFASGLEGAEQSTEENGDSTYVKNELFAWGVDAIYDMAVGIFPTALDYAGYHGAAAALDVINEIASKYIFEGTRSTAYGEGYNGASANRNAASALVMVTVRNAPNILQAIAKRRAAAAGATVAGNGATSLAAEFANQGSFGQALLSNAGGMGYTAGITALMYTGANVWDNMAAGQSFSEAVSNSKYGENILRASIQTVCATAGRIMTNGNPIGQTIGSAVGTAIGTAAIGAFTDENGTVSQGACAAAGGAVIAGGAVGLTVAIAASAAVPVVGLAVLAGAAVGFLAVWGVHKLVQAVQNSEPSPEVSDNDRWANIG